MESPVAQTFPCPECGKRLRWKPAVAGKTGRCVCGAKFRAPDSLGTPDEEDLLYGLAPPAAPAAEPAAPVTESAVAVAEPSPAPSAPHPEVMEYAAANRHVGAGQSPEEDVGALDPGEPVREIYIPTGILVLGFGLILAWLGFKGKFLVEVATAAILIAGIMMVIKTVVLTLVAWGLARRSGGSLGNPLTTILKIAALIVVLDASLLWTWAAMKTTGVISPNGRFSIFGTLFIVLLVYTVVAAVIAQLAYGLHGSEANIFSRLIASGNLVLNVVTVIVMVIVIQSIMTAARRARGINTPAPALITIVGPKMAAPVMGPPTGPTNSDQVIARRISTGGSLVMEGQEWKQSGLTPFKFDKKPVSNLIDQLYNAGAVKVYVDSGDNEKLLPTTIYAELPGDVAKRTACAQVVMQYLGWVGPATPPGGRFLKIKVNE